MIIFYKGKLRNHGLWVLLPVYIRVKLFFFFDLPIMNAIMSYSKELCGVSSLPQEYFTSVKLEIELPMLQKGIFQ